jgi:Mg2+-importing ATPase
MEAGLADYVAASPEGACRLQDVSTAGLTRAEAAERLRAFGPNHIRNGERPSLARELWRRLRNPLNALLLALAVLSWGLSDSRSAIVIAAMVTLSVGLSFVQEHRSTTAAAKLATMVRVRCTVSRKDDPSADPDGWIEAPLEALTPGDVVRLSAGALIPADIRLLSAHDLFVDQAPLTGESLPVEKTAAALPAAEEDLLAAANLCFMGSSVTSGLGTGLVLRTGVQTYLGKLSEKLDEPDVATSFDKGLGRFVQLMIGFIVVMAPAVFLINGVTKHDWIEALFFAVAVAVGLTPEMLPMIVTVNLARGAVAMSRRRVIVKRLPAIQNLGAMDVLCTDKTGTLTQNRIVLKLHLDLAGQPDERVLSAAYLNSRFQSGLPSMLDEAVLDHVREAGGQDPSPGFAKVDEIPFDFTRRRLSVVVRKGEAAPLLICKGAVEEVLSICTRCRFGEEIAPLDADHRSGVEALTRRLNEDGFRVVAVASREVSSEQLRFTVADEADLTLLGFVAFLDPPKETAAKAIADFRAAGVRVKILTGDNDLVTRKVCREVGLEISRVVLGRELESMTDEALAEVAEQAEVFAKASPVQKARVVAALRSRGHVVGFLGDGINDGPALRAADVGISVDTAADVAKEAASIILLEKSLGVLNDGVLEGRRVFANILKYIRMGASSNFGNMFSVLGGSILLPFLPMAPLQVLTNNLLYDLSQTAIPTDSVDPEFLARPRRWEIGAIARFMLLFGPVSSIFDYATFAVMLGVFHAGRDPALFQTGWFVESLLTQTLIIHIIRTAKIPFIQSRASNALILTSLLVAAIGMALPYSPLGAALGMKPLPALYWPIVFALLGGYALLGHLVKRWFAHRWSLF